MISNPNRLHGMSHDDARNPIASCPARQNELYVVPARYALAEHPARHASLQPAVRASSHPMALRRLRGGFLYLWHGQGPLQRYAVAADGLLQAQPLTADESVLLRGSQAGFALDKRHDAWLLYSEIPLGADACAQLAEAGIRQRRMRHVALGEVALRLQALHCPPLDASETLLAELMPEVRERVLAKEHTQNREADKRRTRELAERMNAAPTQENVRAYIHAMEWYNAGSQAAMRHPQAEQEDTPGAWSAQVWEVPATSAWLDSARSEAGELHAVLAVLDDDLGVL
ncbi:toxin VasX, partial [Pseudomonas citronellolis]